MCLIRRIPGTCSYWPSPCSSGLSAVYLNGGTRIPMFSCGSGSGIEAHYVGAQLLAALGLVCYLLGILESRLARRMERNAPAHRPFDPQRVKAISRLLFLAGYLGAAAIFWKEGGVVSSLKIANNGAREDMRAPEYS